MPAEVASFQALPEPAYYPQGVSADGSVVVGSGSDTAWRWTQEAGITVTLSNYLAGAYAVSGDGSVVVGEYDFGPDAFRWTWTPEGGQMVDLGEGTATGVSADGSVVVGFFGNREAFRWTQGTGRTALGHLPGGGSYSGATGVSGDGSAVVGYTGWDFAAVRWIGQEILNLGYLNGGGNFALANAVSWDGTVIVGTSDSTNGNQEAFIWTLDTGMVGLGDLPDGLFRSGANGVSAAGSVVVGQGSTANGQEAFVWRQGWTSMRSLKNILVSDYELTDELAGWQLSRAAAVSADGSTIVGWGINPAGRNAGWIARLPNTPTGVDVVVFPDVGTEITFVQVDSAGDTTVTMTNDVPNPLTGFLVDDTYYDIQSTAEFTGTITICITYDDTDLLQDEEEALILWHYKDGEWQDITDELDTGTNTICGETDGFSLFAVGLRSPAAMIEALAQSVVDLNLHHGIENALDAKLDSALRALDDLNENNDVAAINSLNAFINAGEAQRDEKIPGGDADALIAIAQEIIAVINAG